MTDEERDTWNRRIYGEDGKSFDSEMLDIAARKCFAESESRQMEKALELTAAGWTAETPNHTPHPFTGSVQVMSWYWRRPSRRPGKPGRRYLSTDQAWNAYQKELKP